MSSDDFNPDFASSTEHAHFYRGLGWQAVPAKNPVRGLKYWKMPAIPWRALQHLLVSDEQFNAWFGPDGSHTSGSNIGVITGACSSNLFVVDLDTQKGPEADLWWSEMESLQAHAGELETVTQNTGGGGIQLFYRAPDGWIPPTAKNEPFKVDIRGQGGFVIIAPSIHDSGRHYEWQEGLEPWSIEVTTAPDWFCAEIDKLCLRGHETSASTIIGDTVNQSKTISSPVNSMDPFGRISDGREDLMKRMIWSKVLELYRDCPIIPSEREQETIKHQLYKEYILRCVSRINRPGTSNHILLEEEGRGHSLFSQKWTAAMSQWDEKVAKHAADPPPNRITNSIDTGKRSPIVQNDHLSHANSALDLIGRKNILSSEPGVYFYSEDGVWKKEPDISLRQKVQRLLAQNGVKVTSALINGTVEVLKNEIYIPGHKFNLGQSETINCRNGELELVDGCWKIYQHRRELYRTSQIPVAYKPDASAPMFMKFLQEIFRDDPDKEDKIQSLLELIGVTLMPHARHEKFVILIDAGANGKSVFLSILQALVGSENVAAVQPSKFDRPFQRAHLEGKLANIITEMAQGEIIADAELKSITSGEPSTVEHKYGPPFVMHPFATCWFGTNHMPRTKDFSDALFRRATIITFNRTFAPREQDSSLKERLKGELAGILKMALDAYTTALTKGFTEPKSSAAAKQEWRREVDQVAQFVDECCEPDQRAEETFTDLFHAYKVWATNEGVQLHMGNKGFRERLSRLGYGIRRASQSRYVTGLRLNVDTRHDADFG